MRTLAMTLFLAAASGCATSSGAQGGSTQLDCRGSCASKSDACMSKNGVVSKNDDPKQNQITDDQTNAGCTSELQACIGACPPGV